MKRFTIPLDQSGAVPAWWLPLFEASGNTSIFLTEAWMQSWIEVYGADFKGLWIHWELDGQVVGGCLLLERIVRLKGIPFRTLFLNATGRAVEATPLAEFNDVLHMPGHEGNIAKELAALLMERPWARLLLSGHESRGVCVLLIPLLRSVFVEREVRPAPYVDMAGLGGKNFDAAVTGQAGTHLRRNRRQYEQQVGGISIQRASDLAQAKRYFAELRELHLMRWRDRAERTSLASPAVVDFHHRFIERLWAGGHVDLIRGGSSDTAVGYLYNFVLCDKVFFFQSGFNYQEAASMSPGILVHSMAIEYYRLRGVREYDFLAGDARYKRSLANRHRELYWSIVYRDRWWIRWALLARRIWAWLTVAKR